MLREQVSDKKTIGTKNSLAVLWNALLARQGLVAYLPIIVISILMLWGASWQFFWTYTDAARYQCYALTFWLGSSGAHLLPASQCSFLPTPTVAHPPFHVLPVDDPPLTVVLFSVPALVPPCYSHVVFAILVE